MDVAVMLAERAVWLDVGAYKRGGGGPFGRDGQAGWALLVAMPDSVRMRLAEEVRGTRERAWRACSCWVVVAEDRRFERFRVASVEGRGDAYERAGMGTSLVGGRAIAMSRSCSREGCGWSSSSRLQRREKDSDASR